MVKEALYRAGPVSWGAGVLCHIPPVSILSSENTLTLYCSSTHYSHVQCIHVLCIYIHTVLKRMGQVKQLLLQKYE